MKKRLDLTEKQRKTLEPLFDLVRQNTGCVIAAQVFTDGMRIRVLSGSAAKALCEALGGDYTSTISSSYEP